MAPADGLYGRGLFMRGRRGDGVEAIARRDSTATDGSPTGFRRGRSSVPVDAGRLYNTTLKQPLNRASQPPVLRSTFTEH